MGKIELSDELHFIEREGPRIVAITGACSDSMYISHTAEADIINNIGYIAAEGNSNTTLTSPNGTQFKLIVDDNGNLGTERYE